MKKILYAFAALAALTAVSCERNIGEPEVPVTGDGVRISVKARPAETKTHIVSAIDGETGVISYKSYWDVAGESLGIFLFQDDLTASDVPTELVGDFSGENPEFFGRTASALADGQYKMFLYSPYGAYDSTGDGFVVANLKSIQNPVKGSFDPACDLMGWSDDNIVVADGILSLDNLTLQRPMAILRINLYAPDASPVAGQTVTSFKMETPSVLPLTGKLKITTTGNASFDTPVNSVTATIASSEEIKVGGGTPASWTDDSGAIYLVVAPITIPAGTDVTFTMETTDLSGADAIVRTITARQNMAFEAGKVNTIDLKIRGKDFDDVWYAGGSGIEGDPWLIATAEQMTHINVDLESGVTRYYKLIDDIDMTGITGWLPANTEGSFDKKIVFDGDNHTISNMVITGVSGKKYTSIFGVLNGTVKNVKFENCSNTTSENTPIGLLAGWAGVSGGGFTARIENVHATNCTVSSAHGTNNVGGLVGSANKTDFINCSFGGTVERTGTGDSKYRYVGGLCGGVPSGTNYAYFENCSTSGTLTAPTNSMGGILGGMDGNATAEFKGCSSTMTINANGGKVIGGILGYTGGAKLTDCQYDGTITTTLSGAVYAGGIAAYTPHWLEVYNCTSKGKIDAADVGQRVGGIVGSCEPSEGDTQDIIIQNCQSTMTIYGGNYAGGILGYFSNKTFGGSRTVTGCSYSGEFHGASNSGGLVGYAYNATISRCAVSGTIVAGSGGNNPGGGLTGRSDYTTIEDCSVSGTFTANGQRGAAIIGNGAAGNDIVRRCFTDAALLTRQLNIGGIIGISSGGNSEANFAKQMNITVEKCIVWSPTIKAQGGTTAQWSSGAIIGAAGKFHTLTDNYRSPDLVLTYTNAGASLDPAWPILYDQENTTTTVPLLFYNGAATPPDWAQTPYHGKAAAADKTAAQVASDLGWPTDVWDLTGSVPKLK